ncbi:hypothetical protein L2725_14675 [Shewanella corallii]|uniref:Uncharacterized protein n=1 Tax=Shewanella corallii TaxID=560080 RepID=A0ABT0N9G8_9GAMM|nr:hypothetical protein [Shewanella corallii]MCL2915002.1 hypothetical protein [Shewanella corallii]
MNSNHKQSKGNITNTTDIESKDMETRDKLTLIEDALIESVSGGREGESGLCIPVQFCEVDPPKHPGE